MPKHVFLVFSGFNIQISLTICYKVNVKDLINLFALVN